jgi:hypothetical protein
MQNLIFSALASSEFDVEWVQLMIFSTEIKYDILVKLENFNIRLSYELLNSYKTI